MCGLFNGAEYSRIYSKFNTNYGEKIVGPSEHSVVKKRLGTSDIRDTVYTRIIRAYFFRNLAKKNWGARNI